MSVERVATKEIDRSEALLWLNDRLGETAAVFLHVPPGDGSYGQPLLWTGGALQHWRQTDLAPIVEEEKRDEFYSGMYMVGDDCCLDLGRLPGDVKISAALIDFRSDDGESVEKLKGVMVELNGGARLVVVIRPDRQADSG